MMINTNQEKIKEILERGVDEIFEKESLLKKLQSGKQLRIKFGIDPTGPKIHIGRAIPFWKLRDFQGLGHKIVLIIGDFTATIGDASDKQAMRKPLSEEEIRKNMKDYEKQIGKILDMRKVELRYNNEWFKKMKVKDFVSLQMLFTAQQTIQRRNFKERWSEGKAIGLHELDYPLFQGYDSVVVKADVEVGGSDQLFNLQAGREIQKTFKQKPQDIMTFKMLNGLDGRKMSTSWGNVVTIIDEPNDMYGKIMSLHDELIPEYFELCAKISLEELEKIKSNLNSGQASPRDIKARLAREIVTLYHNEKAAEKAEGEFNKVFRDKQAPTEISEYKIEEEEVLLPKLLNISGVADSVNEAKRLILEKAVEIDGIIQTEWKTMIKIKNGMIIKVGKRRNVKIKH